MTARPAASRPAASDAPGPSDSESVESAESVESDGSAGELRPPAEERWAHELAALAAEDVTATELAGQEITARLVDAPGNGAAIGGLKVTTEDAWFAARPSGTEDVYKIYAESFKGPEHLAQVQAEAREVVSAALQG